MPANNLKELVAWLKANPTRRRRSARSASAARPICGHRLPEQDRHRIPVRAVSRRRRRSAGPGRRPDRRRLRRGVATSWRNCTAASSRPLRCCRRALAGGARTFRPSTKPARRVSYDVLARALGARRHAEGGRSPSSDAAVVTALADPATRERLADRAGDRAARPADAGGARRASEGRDRQMVADHQGGRRQGRVTVRHCATLCPAVLSRSDSIADFSPLGAAVIVERGKAASGETR